MSWFFDFHGSDWGGRSSFTPWSNLLASVLGITGFCPTAALKPSNPLNISLLRWVASRSRVNLCSGSRFTGSTTGSGTPRRIRTVSCAGFGTATCFGFTKTFFRSVPRHFRRDTHRIYTDNPSIETSLSTKVSLEWSSEVFSTGCWVGSTGFCGRALSET